VVAIIYRGRSERHSETLPERLQTRDWGSVLAVAQALEERATGQRAGWKIGAAAEEIRRAEGVPSPSPGRIYRHTVFESPAELPSKLFINYRNCECEFAFELAVDFPARDKPYTEADAAAGVEAMYPALELGDTVFLDWYGASAYFGSCMDNGGGAAFVKGTAVPDWASMDRLPERLLRQVWKGRGGDGPSSYEPYLDAELAARTRAQCRGRRVREHRYLHRPPLRPAGRHCPR
jgi:2-keto-4-pentenoate hydratase